MRKSGFAVALVAVAALAGCTSSATHGLGRTGPGASLTAPAGSGSPASRSLDDSWGTVQRQFIADYNGTCSARTCAGSDPSDGLRLGAHRVVTPTSSITVSAVALRVIRVPTTPGAVARLLAVAAAGIADPVSSDAGAPAPNWVRATTPTVALGRSASRTFTGVRYTVRRGASAWTLAAEVTG